jgi:hypothetical protein
VLLSKEVRKMKCKTCNRKLSDAELKNRTRECGRCRSKRNMVREFIKACDEFKERTGYDDIIKERARRAECKTL